MPHMPAMEVVQHSLDPALFSTVQDPALFFTVQTSGMHSRCATFSSVNTSYWRSSSSTSLSTTLTSRSLSALAHTRTHAQHDTNRHVRTCFSRHVFRQHRHVYEHVYTCTAKRSTCSHVLMNPARLSNLRRIDSVPEKSAYTGVHLHACFEQVR